MGESRRGFGQPRSGAGLCVETAHRHAEGVALEVFERYAGLNLRKDEVREGTFAAVKEGEVVRKERFRPDHDFVEEVELPAVRAPGQREACLSTLALLAAAA